MQRLIVIATFCLSFGLSNANAQAIYLSCQLGDSQPSSVTIDLDTKTVEMDGKIYPEGSTTISASQVAWKRKVPMVSSALLIAYAVSREDLSYTSCVGGSCSTGECEVAEPPKKVF